MTGSNSFLPNRLCMVVVLLTCALGGCSSDDILAPAYGSIRGVVKNSRTRTPLENVQIYSLPGTGLALTNVNGAFQMEDVLAGNYILKAIYRDTSFTGYATLPVRVNANTVTNADMILKPGAPGLGVIVGHVIDEAGKPVVGASVTTNPETIREVTNADGSFLITDVSYDSVTVRVSNGLLFGVLTIQLVPDVITEITITTYPQDPTKGCLKGKVTSKGEPVSDAIVRVDALSLTDTTDDQGDYFIRNVPVGVQQITVSRDGFASRTLAATMTAGVVTNRDVSLGATTMIPTDNLELYVPVEGDIDDWSPQGHRMNQLGSGIKFVADRFGRERSALQFDGTSGVTTLDAEDMNPKPMTMAAWMYIPSVTSPVNLILGKTPHPTGDGYYIILEKGKLVFIWATANWGSVSRAELNATFPRNEWFWIGFAVNNEGIGYITINGTVAEQIPRASNNVANKAQFVIGNLKTTTTDLGFEGRMDHIVLYSSYKSPDELKRIMEVK